MIRDGKPKWHAVSLRHGTSSLLDHAVGKWEVPAPRWPTRCVCCNVETPYKMEYRPDSSSYVTAPFRVPRCRECEKHVATRGANVFLLFVVLATAVGCIALAIARSIPLLIVPGATIFGALVVIAIVIKRRRRQLQKQGHYTGFEVNVVANAIGLRTTNPQLAADFVELNSRR